MEASKDTISSGCVLSKDHVAGLLTAERIATLAHRLKNITVTHTGLDDVDSCISHGDLQAKVRHHGRNQSVSSQSTLFTKRERQNRHDVIAIHDGTGVIYRQAAIGIAVVGDTQVCLVADNRGLEG